MLLLVLLVGGGAALYYFKFRKPKQNVKGRDDLDEYEFGDEDFEDEEPVKKDDKRYIYGMLNCIACRNGRLWLTITAKEAKIMFSENLKQIRKKKGISQEELAARLNVVRQTISKWEKGLSVPDAELLIKLSEILETSVGTLLGDTIEAAADKNVISQQLEQLNAQLAEKNRRSRRIWKTAAIVFIILAVLSVLLYAGGIATFHSFSEM